MRALSLFAFIALQFIQVNADAKGFESCNMPQKWILPIVRATGGESKEADKVPQEVMEKLDKSCTDDITQALTKDKLNHAQVAVAIKRSQDSRKQK